MPARGPLDDYRRKRDFRRTSEPAPGPDGRATKTPVFVVHRHEARNLHDDLRLELDGVLLSWAVPKGFSYDPADKRLAVRTEDHPIESMDFEGLIPGGEYGAGAMTIWDHGTVHYLPEGDGHGGSSASATPTSSTGARTAAPRRISWGGTRRSPGICCPLCASGRSTWTGAPTASTARRSSSGT
jgi:bifunctional non-homologous end joining protein LigD